MNKDFDNLEKEFKRRQKISFYVVLGILFFLVLLGFILYLGLSQNLIFLFIILFLIFVSIILFFIYFFKMIKFHKKLIDIWDEKIFVHEKMHGFS